jgi:hypothetical protein
MPSKYQKIKKVTFLRKKKGDREGNLKNASRHQRLVRKQLDRKEL